MPVIKIEVRTTPRARSAGITGLKTLSEQIRVAIRKEYEEFREKAATFNGGELTFETSGTSLDDLSEGIDDITFIVTIPAEIRWMNTTENKGCLEVLLKFAEEKRSGKQELSTKLDIQATPPTGAR